MNSFVATLLLATFAVPTWAQLLADGVHVPCGIPATKVVAAELDGQPGTDLAMVADTDGTLSILRNLGNGTFADPQVTVIEAGVFQYSLCAADLDGDLDTDLVVGRGSRPLLILFNDGAASYTPGGTIPTNGQFVMREIVAGDIDGDGDNDIVWGNPTFGGGLWLAINEGGAFAAPFELFHSKADDPVLAHLNDDSDLDIAFHRASTREVVILFGEGDGTFQTPVTCSVGGFSGNIFDLATADLDGDGDRDLLFATGIVDEYYQVYSFALLNQGDGSFVSTAEIAWDFFGPPYSIIAPDLAGSGCPWIMQASGCSGHMAFPNDCSGFDLENFEVLSPSAEARDLTAADLDGDGDLDVVYAVPGNNSVLVHLNTRLGPMAPPVLSLLLADPGIHLSWTASPGATAYRVYGLGALGGEESLLLETAATEASFPVVDGVALFVVRAVR